MLPGDADVQEVVRHALDLPPEAPGDEIDPGQDEDEDGGRVGEAGGRVDARERGLGEARLELRVVDDDEPPGLGILGGRSGLGRPEAGQDLLALDGLRQVAADAPPVGEDLLKRGRIGHGRTFLVAKFERSLLYHNVRSPGSCRPPRPGVLICAGVNHSQRFRVYRK